jgi:hypothetical protein
LQLPPEYNDGSFAVQLEITIPSLVLVIKCFFPVKNILEAIMFFFPYIYFYLTGQQVFNQMMTYPATIMNAAMKNSQETI